MKDEAKHSRGPRKQRGPRTDPEKAPMPFGVELKRLRLQARMTQAQLASAAGVSPGYIGLIETGDRGSAVSREIVKRLCQCVGAGIDEAETLLKLTGHLAPHESLVAPKGRPTMAVFVATDAQLTTEQKAILLSVYRSWVGHD